MKSNFKLGDIAEVVMGQSPKGEDVNEIGEGFPLLNGPTEFTNYNPIPVQFTNAGRKFSEENDILFCVRGSTTGRMNYADRKYAIGRGLAAIRGKKGYTTPYIRAVIEVNLNHLLSSATGSTFPNVSRDLLLNLEVPSISVSSSLVVSKIIEAKEKKIELNRKINKNLEQMTQAIFNHWFIDFEFPNEKGRPYKSNGGEMQDSGLGEMPKGWRVGKLSNILNHSRESITPSNYPEIIYSHYSLPAYDAGFLPIKERGADILSNKFLVKKYSILVSKLNPRIPRVWSIGDIVEEGSICSTEFQVFVPKESFYYSFANVFFSMQSTIDVMKSRASGTSGSHQRISPQDIMDIDLIIPGKEILIKFDSIVRNYLERKFSNLHESQALSKIRDLLLPKLMSGEMLVNR